MSNSQLSDLSNVINGVSTPTYDPVRERVRLESVVLWIDEYLKDHKCSITASGDIEVCSVIKSVSDVLGDIKLQYDWEYKRANRQLDRDDQVDPASGKLLEDALRKQINETWADHLVLKNEELKNISFEDLSHLSKFIKACIGVESTLSTYVLAHWIWQVKRKMRSMPVYNHVMVVFTGTQGGGKSSAIDILTRPLRDYRSDMGITQLADERNYHSLEKTFVIVADEMQGCNKTDIEYLKHMITAQAISARKLYTNSRDKIIQNASLIGSSNKPIDLLIRDETGMRRFFAVNCSDRLDWKTLNELNVVELWQSIDESRPEGYLCEVLKELQEHQEDYRYRDSVENYLEETKSLGANRNKQVAIRELFADYVDWCKESQNKPFDKNYFSRRLRALRIQPWRTKSARGVMVDEGFTFWRDQIVESNSDILLREADEICASLKII